MKKQVVMTSKGVVVVDTVKEAVAILAKDGIEVTQKAVLAGNVAQVQIVDESEVAAILAASGAKPEAEQDEPTVDPVLTDKDDKALTDKDADSDDTFMDTKSDAEKARELLAKQDNEDVGGTQDEVEYPEVGHFKDEKAMKKWVKKLTDAQLFDWCELEGLTWKRCPEHAPIDRMRAAMVIKGKHFPATAPKASAKSKSKYADYTTDKLIEMCLEHDIEVIGDNGDMRILRMKAIMALREAGVIA